MNSPPAPYDDTPGKATVAGSALFRELVEQCDAHIARGRSPVAMIGNDNLGELLACIREQQQTIKACMTFMSGEETNKSSLIFAIKQARAVLSKWRLT